MSKFRLIFAIFFFFFVAVLMKLFHLQVVSPRVSSNYLKYKKIYPERGKVFDRNHQPLALNQTTYLLYVEPKKIKDTHDAIKVIDKELNLGEATIEALLDKNKEWVAIRSGIVREQKKRLEAEKVAGLGFQPTPQRYYPESSLAAHLLGFVGKNRDGEDTGYFGIEGYYDKDLYGLPGILKSERDTSGRPILIGTQEKTESENGRDLILTIDKSVQNIVKRELLAGIERYKAREGCAIVADPMTLELTALVCLPDFDPDKYYKSSEEFFANPAINLAYEPGSTFKPLIMAAALNEKKLKPGDLYNETGPVEKSGYRIKTWNDKYEGKITMTRILEKSSNVGMVYVGDKLGRDNLYEYLERYGFDQKTGIDLQGEFAPRLRSRHEWRDIDFATAAFGQGIAVTPMQMITAFASIINGGELMQPHAVGVISYQGLENTIKKRKLRSTISKKTSDMIKKMLVSTVEHGEYKWAAPAGYKIGGKTGTAQIAVQGKYDPSKFIASFIGFAPASTPKFLALVVLKEPKTSIYGSETAAPLFFEIARELLVYYNIAPEQ